MYVNPNSSLSIQPLTNHCTVGLTSYNIPSTIQYCENRNQQVIIHKQHPVYQGVVVS